MQRVFTITRSLSVFLLLSLFVATAVTLTGCTELDLTDEYELGKIQQEGGISDDIAFIVVGQSSSVHKFEFWVDGNSDEVCVGVQYSEGFGEWLTVELFRDRLWPLSNISYNKRYYNNPNTNFRSQCWTGVYSEYNHFIEIRKYHFDGDTIEGKFFVSTD